MSDEVTKYMIIVGGVVVVVVIALVLNRRLRIRLGDKSVETGGEEKQEVCLNMRATGPGSRICRTRQSANADKPTTLSMTADKGGEIADAKQEAGRHEPGS